MLQICLLVVCVHVFNKKTDLDTSQIENGIEMSTESCYRTSNGVEWNGFFHGLNRAICMWFRFDCCLKHTISFLVVLFLTCSHRKWMHCTQILLSACQSMCNTLSLALKRIRVFQTIWTMTLNPRHKITGFVSLFFKVQHLSIEILFDDLKFGKHHRIITFDW